MSDINSSIVGEVFGRWKVLEFLPIKEVGKSRMLLVECSCGTTKEVNAFSVKSGKSKSCGCFSSEVSAKRATKHGLSKHPLYNMWGTMKSRCNNPNSTEYHRYGARGISVCKRWSESFSDFLSDMGERPTENHQIDRIDNEGDYSVENCKWATPIENSSNTRRTVVLSLGERTETLAEWSRILGVNPTKITHRLKKGLTFEQVYSELSGGACSV